MPRYTQANRPLAITTALGEDALLLAGLSGRESLSQPFFFELELLAEKTVSFDRLLGQPASIRLNVPGSPERLINGIIARLRQGAWRAGIHGPNTLLSYQATLVPNLWLLGRRTDSRVFQLSSVPDILHAVLHDQWQLDVKQTLAETYLPRDYCVQYDETDLAFVSRLMEEEGIYYYFEHTKEKHILVLADSPKQHPDLAGGALSYDDGAGGMRQPLRVTAWNKTQQMCVCKHTLRDYWFELPENTLEANHQVAASAKAGQVEHQLLHQVSRNGLELLERYQYPGGYGWRYDSIDRGGNDQSDNLPNVFPDSERTSRLRAEQEAAQALLIEGKSPCGHLQPGHRFDLQKHFDGDGGYLLTSLEHEADMRSAYLAGASNEPFLYACSFQAMPGDLPYRSQSLTPRPRIPGYHTATVTGALGAEIPVDQFGRVKVKFHWDRRETADQNSSCWLRVAQVWAGNRWGAFFWPRVGHEVVVVFEEGDPDRPLIVGSVYNNHNMPPFPLPLNSTLAGFKSFSATGIPNAPANPITNFNGILFDDAFGEEHLEMHGEKHIKSFCEHQSESHINGPQRTNTNGKHSLHVGKVSMPGSGKGGGFEFSNPLTDLDSDWGVLLTSVCGVNQCCNLGLYDTFTVGEVMSLNINPVSLATDLSGFAGLAGPGIQTAIAAFGATFGATLGVTMGSATSLNVGTQIGIARAGRAAVSHTANFQDTNTDAEQASLLKVVEGLALLSATLATVGAFKAGLNSYSTSQDDWLGWFMLGGMIGGIWAEVEIVNAIYTQMKKMKETGEAATAAANEGVTAKGFATVADGLVTLFKNDQQTLNKLAYTSGTRGEYAKGVIVGAEELNMLFAGKTANSQSVVGLDTSNIKLALGTPGSGPRILMTTAPTPSITLAVGLPDVGPRIILSETSITLAVGAGPDLCNIVIDDTGILSGTLNNDNYTFVGFSTVQAAVPANTLVVGTAGVSVSATNLDLTAQSAFNINAATLEETVMGIVEREAGVSKED